jgi:uncharacterized protein
MPSPRPAAREAIDPEVEVSARIRALPWTELAGELAERGFARIPGLLDAHACRALIALYARPERFRSRVIMSRHGYGRGEYQYFDHPLPTLVAAVREAAYPELAPIANQWAEQLVQARRFPASLGELHTQCHEAGQTRPTPLLLKYGVGDYNCLHQDVYGELLFPLQLAVLLSAPGADFDGGEFVLTEQRPRMQSRVEVVPLDRGDAVLFAVQHRPVIGTRGPYRVNMRHGVSRIRRGERYTLGLIFHDAT